MGANATKNFLKQKQTLMTREKKHAKPKNEKTTSKNTRKTTTNMHHHANTKKTCDDKQKSETSWKQKTIVDSTYNATFSSYIFFLTVVSVQFDL